jgi:hypothetical protein
MTRTPGAILCIIQRRRMDPSRAPHMEHVFRSDNTAPRLRLARRTVGVQLVLEHSVI